MECICVFNTVKQSTFHIQMLNIQNQMETGVIRGSVGEAR